MDIKHPLLEGKEEEVAQWARQVRRSRDYVLGKQYTYLTQKQRDTLNLRGDYGTFSANYCEMIVRMMADRLTVAGFLAAEEEWLGEWRQRVRFDELQIDVHEAVLRDGDCFLLLDYDDENRSLLRLGYAYDGNQGLIPIYDGDKLTALKVSKRGDEVIIDEWRDGIVHFAHRRLPGHDTGQSEVANITNLQDALNRIIASMIVAGELSAYRIIVMKGATPPDKLEPGAFLTIPVSDPAVLAASDVKSLEQGKLTEYISEIDRVIDLIAEITQTPIASVLGTNPSGEALKQREVGLLSKVRAAQVKLGNSWEDAVRMCARSDALYAGGAEIDKIDTRWESPEVRGTDDLLKTAATVYNVLYDKQLFVESAAELFDWSEERQAEILERVEQMENARADKLLGGLSGLNGPRGRRDG